MKTNMSSSATVDSILEFQIASLEYRDIAGQFISASGDGSMEGAPIKSGRAAVRAEVEMSEAELAARIQQERADARNQAEQTLRQDFEAKLAANREQIVAAIAAFEGKQTTYFARVEAEVVQLALAIAAKILHREAQVDPMLVAALVRITIEKMSEGSAVTVRVGSGRARQWQQYFAAQPGPARVVVIEDEGLTNQDCLVETELGSTNMGLDSQLKEVEQGFFDLLALRPDAR